MSDAARKRHLWNAYRLTPEEWDKIEAWQDGVCPICREPQPPQSNGRPKRLATDHSHLSGEVRGLLCSRCNPLLGKLENNFRRFGLHKVPGMTPLVYAQRIANYLAYPPAQSALGRKVIGYPGKTGTAKHRKWIKQNPGT